MMAATITSVDPIPTQSLRPKLSAMYDVGIKARKAPSDTAAIIRPVPLGLSPLKNLVTIFCRYQLVLRLITPSKWDSYIPEAQADH